MENMNLHYSLNANPLVQHLQKPACDFTKDDIIQYMEAHAIRMLNFRYVAEDGRLKTLNFVVSSYEHLNDILTYGERVDGSSLFSFMEAGSSDLYVVPRYSTAFLNPFTEEPALEILCSFYDPSGHPLESSPEYILQKAVNHFNATTGLEMKFLGELEYYVNSKSTSLFPATDQRGYHESEPFAKFEGMRKEALRLIARCGGQIKYGHAEVGTFQKGNELFEQHEIEFLPTHPLMAADQLVLAKWILRMLADKMGVEISFAPKISVGKAGSGLHFHMLAEENGINIVTREGVLSAEAKKMIAGIMSLADALTAFGNTVPTSYLRLVPNQEAPTYICWGERNRSALVRVPLGWNGTANMLAHANPNIQIPEIKKPLRQTFEFRVPDGSANIYLTIAGLMVACRHGLTDLPDALTIAENLYVDGNIFKTVPRQKLEQLPPSCHESANRLHLKREIFEKGDVFPIKVINHSIEKLKAYKDENLQKQIQGNNEEIRNLVLKYIHCQ